MKNKYLLWTFKFLTWFMILAVGIMMLIYWTYISEIVGIHTNLAGDIDLYGSKSTLIMIWIITVIIQLLYTFDYRMKSGGFNLALMKNYPILYHFIYLFVVICISCFLITRIIM